VVNDSPGFLVNRILTAYLAEASHLVKEGVFIELIDEALLKFGMPMGPFALIDEIGIDVAAKVSHIMETAFGERLATAGTIDKVVADGRLGKKGGRGFYLYHKGKEKTFDPAIYELLAISPRIKPLKSEIQERCVLAMINEAARCLEEKIIRRPEDVDIGMIFGTGFPPFRGGLLRYTDKLGSEKVVERLLHFTQSIGGRFEPAGLMKEMANAKRGFYAA